MCPVRCVTYVSGRSQELPANPVSVKWSIVRELSVFRDLNLQSRSRIIPKDVGVFD
jgi:hypothetical protein